MTTAEPNDQQVDPLRSLGELSKEVARRMLCHPSWTDLVALEQKAPSLAEKNRANFERHAPVPTESQARALLDAAFFASMLEEEGRRMALTLAFVSPDATHESKDFTAFVFAKSIELTPSALAKLAPSTLPDATYIAVAPDPVGKLEIWGLLHRGDRTFGVDQEFFPPCLLLRVHRAGTLSARYMGGLLFLYTKGAIHFLSLSADLLGQLRDRFRVTPVVAEVLCRLALRILEHGHGGALLVGQCGATPLHLAPHPSYRPHQHPSKLLKDAVDEYEADLAAPPPSAASLQKVVHQRYRAERRYRDALAFVAQLTAVDGATMLDDELHLLGFGAIVQTSGAPDTIRVQVEDVYAGTIRTTTVGEFPGTRHRAAIQFCANQPEGSLALALVASQDGQLSVFAKADKADKDTVVAIRSFELGIGV